MTKVVNLYKNTYDIYIGRAGKGQEGYFGNPVVIGKTCLECGKTHLDGGSTLPCYRKYLDRRIKNDSTFKRRVQELHGKVLGCFCKPKPCHGDVLAEVAESLWYISTHTCTICRTNFVDADDGFDTCQSCLDKM